MLTRVPAVFEDELTDIMFSDRSYVAAEMTAFLLFWLSRLRCPVLNEPTATCLAGRYWRREQWIDQAARAGIAAHAFRRDAREPFSKTEAIRPSGGVTVTVVGNDYFGDVHPDIGHQAKRIANLAGVRLLAVRFANRQADARFLEANTFPDLMHEHIAEAVIQYMLHAAQKRNDVGHVS